MSASLHCSLSSLHLPAHIHLIEVLGATSGDFEDIPLLAETKHSDRIAHAMVVCCPDVWAWLQWFHDHSLNHPPPKEEPTSLQYLGLGMLGNLIPAYGIHRDITLEALHSTPRFIYPLTVYHLRGHLDMQLSMKIAILLKKVVGHDDLIPLFVE